MIEVKDLLQRFDRLLLSEESKRESVRKAVSEVLKTEISPDKVRIKGSVVYLDLKPIYKNEIFLRQEEILKKLDTAFLGRQTPLSIR